MYHRKINTNPPKVYTVVGKTLAYSISSMVEHAFQAINTDIMTINFKETVAIFCETTRPKQNINMYSINIGTQTISTIPI